MQHYHRGSDGGNLGIENEWHSSTPIVEEVIEDVHTEEPDPLQSEDPWSNSRLPSEVLPTQLDPILETTTTDIWSG